MQNNKLIDSYVKRTPSFNLALKDLERTIKQIALSKELCQCPYCGSETIDDTNKGLYCLVCGKGVSL